MGRLLEVHSQLVGLDAAKDGYAQIRNADMTSTDAIRIEALVPVPPLQEEGSFTFPALPVPGRDKADQFIAQDQ